MVNQSFNYILQLYNENGKKALVNAKTILLAAVYNYNIFEETDCAYVLGFTNFSTQLKNLNPYQIMVLQSLLSLLIPKFNQRPVERPKKEVSGEPVPLVFPKELPKKTIPLFVDKKVLPPPGSSDALFVDKKLVLADLFPIPVERFYRKVKPQLFTEYSAPSDIELTDCLRYFSEELFLNCEYRFILNSLLPLFKLYNRGDVITMNKDDKHKLEKLLLEHEDELLYKEIFFIKFKNVALLYEERVNHMLGKHLKKK